MIALAYSMEMGLGIVYTEMAKRSDDAELKSLLIMLADIETRRQASNRGRQEPAQSGNLKGNQDDLPDIDEELPDEEFYT